MSLQLPPNLIAALDAWLREKHQAWGHAYPHDESAGATGAQGPAGPAGSGGAHDELTNVLPNQHHDADQIVDDDGDTKIQVEEGDSDEDIMRFDVEGTETLRMGDSGGAGTFAGAAHAMHFPMQADEDILIDGSTNPRTIDTGVMRFEQKPSIENTRALTVNLDVDSQPNSNALVLNLTATQIAAGERISALLINIIKANSTGGKAHAIEMSLIGTGGVEAEAIHVNPNVAVIHQASGSFGNVEKAWEFTSGPTWTDDTAAFNSAGTDVEIFTLEDDIVYIGMAAKFDHIEVVLATTASGAGIKPAFAFSTGGSGFTAFIPEDPTQGMRQDGIIEWDNDDIGAWAHGSVNGTADKYWIRITRTAVALTTPPIEDTIQVQAVTVFEWDADGDVTINNLDLAGNLSLAAAKTLRIGLATTDGVLLKLTGGFLQIREGDDSADAPMTASAVTAGTFNATTQGTIAVLKLSKTTLTLDAGTGEIITPLSSWVYLTSAGATDSLEAIGAGQEGQIVYLTPLAGKDITLVHNGTETAGKKMMIAGEANYVMDEDHDFAIAVYDATASVWDVLVPGGGGGGSHTHMKQFVFTGTQEDAQVETMVPSTHFIGEDADHGTLTLKRFKVWVSVKGVTGTLTVKLYRVEDSEVAGASEVEIATVDITTGSDGEDTSVGALSTDQWLRAKITAIHSGTAAKDVNCALVVEEDTS